MKTVRVYKVEVVTRDSSLNIPDIHVGLPYPDAASAYARKLIAESHPQLGPKDYYLTVEHDFDTPMVFTAGPTHNGTHTAYHVTCGGTDDGGSLVYNPIPVGCISALAPAGYEEIIKAMICTAYRHSEGFDPRKVDVVPAGYTVDLVSIYWNL